MRVEQEQVALFHDRYGYENPGKPELGQLQLVFDREALMSEELDEYFEAGKARDLVQLADAIADLAYTVIGTAVAHGIDLQPIFDEVHRSNMTKQPAADNPLKPVKGPTFERPRIAELLLMQQTGLDDLPTL